MREASLPLSLLVPVAGTRSGGAVVGEGEGAVGEGIMVPVGDEGSVVPGMRRRVVPVSSVGAGIEGEPLPRVVGGAVSLVPRGGC